MATPKYFVTLLSLFFIFQINTQAQQTISGFVYDKETGEALINAHIYDEVSRKGVLTNTYGFFSFNIVPDTLKLNVSFVGYQKVTQSVHCKKDTSIIITLIPGNELCNIDIKAPKTKGEDFTPVGKISFTGEKLEKLPGLLGEKDIIKSLQLTPGINMGKEGSSGIYVRGGGRGQNLMLLDGMPVYNVNHLFGFFSVFAPEVVKSVDVYKGGFPARYSGRLSSVIDIRLKEGNLKKKKLDVTIGTISSKVIYESPIKKGKSSYLLAIRRTYADLFYTPLNAIKQEDLLKTTKTWSGYNFYDINLKSNFTLSSKDRVYFSIYTGRDKLFLSEQESYNQRGLVLQMAEEFGRLEDRSDFTNQWGNLTLSSRWNHLFNEKLFSNTTISYSTYKYETRVGNEYLQESLNDTLNEHTSFLNLSNIEDIGLASDFDYFAFPWLKTLMGVRASWRRFIPGKLDLNYGSKYSPTDNFSKNIHESAESLYEANGYIETHFSFSTKIFINAGLAMMISRANHKNFFSFQPRMMFNYKPNSNFSVYGSWTKMSQPLHLLVDNGTTFPVDMWVPSVKTLKPARSGQFDLGIKFNISDMYEFRAEMYHKDMNNVLHFNNGESFFSMDETWYEKVTQGKGSSKGIEFLVSKISGKFNGWGAYSLSDSKRQFKTLNSGKPFAFKYNSKHQFKLVGMFSPNKKIDLSASWVYATGMPITLSGSAYAGDMGYARSPLYGIMFDLGFYDQMIYKPENVTYYSGINEQHLPTYHRLDFGVNFIKQKRRGERTWSFSVYNVYARNNPMMIFSETGEDGKLVYKSFSVFTFVPSICYRFSFNAH